ncbi:MAG: GpE family phage tail protein [Rhodospirillales bacterium]|nr:GpE family phage tail protein [Rhodospirillales bacterium]
MADIACIFHWPLTELLLMTPRDLALWHAKARARAAHALGPRSGG